MATEPGGIDPALLDRLRRSVPLRMATTGRLSIGDEPVTHARVLQALRAGLDTDELGEPIVRIGPHFVYLTVDDCPLRATAIAEDGDALAMRLDDGRTVALDPASLCEQPGLGLRTHAPSRHSGRPLAVRLTNVAQMDLAAWLHVDERGPAIVRGGRRWPIVTREGAPG